MINSLITSVFSLFVSFGSSGAAHASMPNQLSLPEYLQPSSLIKTPKRGLFWYDVPTKTETKSDEKYPRPAIPSAEALFQMHPKELKALLDDTLDYAVFKLSPEATMDYYKVLDVARRKSSAFTNLTGFVMLDKPELNAAQDYPITNPGNAEKKRRTDNDVTKKLQAAREEYALLFFTQPACGFCVQQSQILENFQRESGWIIKEVDIIKEPQSRTKFNIDRTPVTVLIRKNGDSKQWMPVSVGVDSLSNLRSNIYRITRLFGGEIKPQQFYTNEQQQGGFFDPLKRQ
ncbi:conjugal transfer protein TraF [Yersinia ruckeri]|uniref:conjugal transfer protein TraF n=1 Tax=Yersinia ruckeri TaxID=29486 RepID=UPI001F1F3630|nr:conjugal transfer protein TraF [Yersinia ruckeri]UIN19285.1 conjugal transfer protein TraF [Yersinia ruckeri]